MKKTYLLLILLGLSPLISLGQLKAKEDTSLVKWLSFKEAFALNKKQPKPFLIDIYTDWCGWCKHMMKTTYAEPLLASYINAYFYPVKFDAETKDTVEYLGTNYMNPGTSRKSTHQLALKLLGQNISYPSTIFSNNNFQFNLLSAGFLEVKKIEPLLIFTLENIFRTTTYEDFQKNYDLAYPEKPVADTTKSKLVWHTFNEAMALHKKKPKKILIDVYTNWCNGCNVMNRSTYKDPKLTAYIDKNFYLVDFNAEQKDSIRFKDKLYINNGANGSPFHPFIVELLNGKMTLPTCGILNENLEVVDALPFFMTAKTLDPILHYYAENIYKTKKWPEYQEQLEREATKDKKAIPVK
jgi:thioredoxin-related protein